MYTYYYVTYFRIRSVSPRIRIASPSIRMSSLRFPLLASTRAHYSSVLPVRLNQGISGYMVRYCLMRFNIIYALKRLHPRYFNDLRSFVTIYFLLVFQDHLGTSKRLEYLCRYLSQLILLLLVLLLSCSQYIVILISKRIWKNYVVCLRYLTWFYVDNVLKNTSINPCIYLHCTKNH